MRAGELDRRITIEREMEVGRDDFNAPIFDWVVLAEVWANRRDVSASESYRAQSIGAEITTRFRIRWSEAVRDVNPKDRISFEGRVYNITAVREAKDGRRVALEIDAVARADTEPGQ